MLGDGIFQFAKSDVLNAGVDREHGVATILRLADAFNVFNDVTATVTNHATATRLAGNLRLERQLKALLALVIDVGKTNQMREQLAARIVAPVFTLQGNSGHTKRHHLRRILRRQMALQVDEITLRISKLFRQFGRTHFEQTRQRSDIFSAKIQGRGGGPHGFNRR